MTDDQGDPYDPDPNGPDVSQEPHDADELEELGGDFAPDENEEATRGDTV